MLLAYVLLQIEQLDAHIFVPLEQLVLPEPHSSRRAAGALITVMRVMPKQRALRGGLTFKQRDEADAVLVLSRTQRKARDLQKSRIVIGADHGRMANAAGLGYAGPAHNQRLAHAAFIGPAFAGAQRGVGGWRRLGSGQASVVRGEEHDRIFFQTRFGKFLEDAPNAFI